MAEHGFDGMAQAIETLFNEAMKLERSAVREAQPYERTPRRRGDANGFNPKTVQTRVGELELAGWLEANVPEGLTVFALPAKLRRRLRTNNLLERPNREIKRRTRVATLFPDEDSLLRLRSSRGTPEVQSLYP